MTPSQAIQSLLDAGCTEAGIAKAVGTSQPTINRIKKGSAPRYEVGARLMALTPEEVMAIPEQPERSAA